ncbi:MAG: PKD domain-containing protein [Tannerella sp.]|jgi:PKD repeat protein|nr:PKD domain-containing protein [Tannerella sp.]
MKKLHLFLLCAVTMASLMMLTISSCGDKDEDIDIIPEFEVSFQDGNDVAPATVLVNNQTTGANAYAWTFDGGDPNESTNQNPGPIRYARPGEYTISLKAYYNAEFEALTKTVTVRPPENVVSNFSISFGSAGDYAPAEATFTDESDNAESYSWTFENGNPATSAQQNPPVVTFAHYGLHNVTLTASNAGGSNTKTQSLKIYPGELVCRSDEIWEGPLMYPGFGQIGSIQYRFAADRSGGASGTRIYIPAEAVAVLLGNPAAVAVLYELPLNWDWLIADNGQQFKVEVNVNGNKGIELSNFAFLENGGFALTNTAFDDQLKYLLTADGAALLIPVLEQDIVYTKKSVAP